jgi:hypothetical protein
MITVAINEITPDQKTSAQVIRGLMIESKHEITNTTVAKTKERTGSVRDDPKAAMPGLL